MRFFLLSIFLLIASLLFSQQAEFAYRHYTTDDGLPSSEVYQVMQDSKGFLWFATDKGVARFDGREFEKFSMQDGLPDNTIFDIYEDYKGRIWFLSFSCKLSYYEEEKIHPYPYNNILRKVIGEGPIRNSFYIDKNDKIFINIKGGGYAAIDKDGKLLSKIKPMPALKTYLRMQEFNSGQLFSMQIDTLVNESCIEYISADGEKKKIISPFFNHSLRKTVKRKNGNLLILFDDIVMEIKKEKAFVYCPKQNIVSINEDRQGNVWLGTLKDGGYYMDSSAAGYSNSATTFLSGYSVSSTLQDHEGGYWFSTLENGVFYTPSKEIKTYGDANGLTNLKASCIADNKKDTLYAGLEDGTLFVLNILSNCSKKYTINSLRDKNKELDEINGIYIDTAHHISWLCSNSFCGMFRFSKDQFLIKKIFNDGIYKIVFTNDDTALFSRYDRFLKMAGEKAVYDSWEKSHINFRVTAMRKDSKNRLLFGGLNGFFYYKNDRFIPFNEKEKLTKYRTTAIKEWSPDTLLLGTRGGGLIIIINDTQFIQIDQKKGLLGNNITGIYLEKKNIWVSSGNGINKIVLKNDGKKLKYEIESFSKKDGLISNEVNQLTFLDNRIWAATNKGISVFYPDKIKLNTSAPPIHITGIKIMNKDTAVASLSLDYHHNFIQIRYSGISFKEPFNILYRYRIEGLDTMWHYTTQTEIPFPSVPPGDYKFIVFASNDNGIWSTVPAAYEFSILPPFWQRWWFKLIIGSCVVFAFYLFYKTRISRERMKRKLVELESKALRAQMNPHFIFNSLNSIQSYIAINENFLAESYLSRFARLMRKILDNSRNSFTSLSSEVQVLTDYLELERMRFAKKFSFSINIAENIDSQATYIPPMIIQPFVENSILHGMADREGNDGKIEINFHKDNNRILCTVDDNGIGRVSSEAGKIKSNAHKSYGSQISEERLNILKHKGDASVSIKITDKILKGKPEGTIVTITLPHELDT